MNKRGVEVLVKVIIMNSKLEIGKNDVQGLVTCVGEFG